MLQRRQEPIEPFHELLQACINRSIEMPNEQGERLTHELLASRLKVSLETLQDWLSGKSAVPREHLLRLGAEIALVDDECTDLFEAAGYRPPTLQELCTLVADPFDSEDVEFMLDEVSPGEAVTLLQSVNPRIDRASARQIARLCDCLSHALYIVAQASLRASYTPSQLVSLLGAERERLLRQGYDLEDLDGELGSDCALWLGYRLLSPHQRQTFARLGVFCGSFSAEALDAVLACDADAAIRDDIAVLCEAGLLGYGERGRSFQLPYRARGFALERLGELGDDPAVLLSHASYYVGRAREAQRLYLSGAREEGLSRYLADQHQLRVARTWLQQQAGEPLVDELLIAEADAGTFMGDHWQLRADERAAQLLAALAAARRRGDRLAEGRCLSNLGLSDMAIEYVELAADYLEQRLVLARAHGERWRAASMSWNCGCALVWCRQLARALPLMEAGYAFYRAIRHPRADVMKVRLDFMRQYGQLPTVDPVDDLIDLPEGMPGEERIEARSFEAQLATMTPGERRRYAEQFIELSYARPAPLAEPIIPDAVRRERARPPRLARALALMCCSEPTRARAEQRAAAGRQAAAPPAEEPAALIAQLEQSRFLAPWDEADLRETMQHMLPLLGDVALAAHGDEEARALVEAALPGLAARGWWFADAVRPIWAGERGDSPLLTGLIERDAVLVRQMLRLVAAGPQGVAVAHSRQIAELRQRAARVLALPLEARERAALAASFERSAAGAAQRPGQLWQALSADLRTWAARLRLVDPAAGG